MTGEDTGILPILDAGTSQGALRCHLSWLLWAGEIFLSQEAGGPPRSLFWPAAMFF